MADMHMRMRGFDGLRLGPNWLSRLQLGTFNGEWFERSGFRRECGIFEVLVWGGGANCRFASYGLQLGGGGIS